MKTTSVPGTALHVCSSLLPLFELKFTIHLRCNSMQQMFQRVAIASELTNFDELARNFQFRLISLVSLQTTGRRLNSSMTRNFKEIRWVFQSLGANSVSY